jgi:membrane protease YdiL (CAAX protease family)
MINKSTARSLALAVPWRFFALAYGISWSIWALALLHAFGGTRVPAVQVLPYAGAFGPCIAAMACAGVEGRAAVGRLFRGILAVRQNWIWYVVTLFLMPSCMALAKMLTGRPPMDPGTPPVPMQPVVLVMVFASILLVAGVGEETGWRGYALPAILARFRPLGGSVVLGCVWAVWHAPLFLLPGTVQHQMLSATGGLLFLAFCVCWSVLFTLLYLATRGSLLMAMLFHASSNFASIFLQPLDSKMALGILTLLMATAAIALHVGGKMGRLAKLS